jgi:SAM-dependent methyltransferase
VSFADHFSDVAAAYAQFRPSYPPALLETLADLAPARDAVLDCATGNGQAAVELARHFRRVVATDASAAQLRNAVRHPRVSYAVASAEGACLGDRSLDLVTVAQAVHWFDLEVFYREVRRMVRPGGVVAAWTYCRFEVDPAVDALIDSFYRDALGPYWPDGFRHVDELYRNLSFPFEEVALPPFFMEATWSLDALAGFVHSWSATQRFLAATGRHPLEDVYGELARAWGPASRTRAVRWRLGLRVGKT